MQSDIIMYNIEKKDTEGIREIRILKYIIFLSRECMTKLAGHTGCAVCLQYDS